MEATSLGELLRPYKPNAVAAEIGVSTQTIYLWTIGKTSPSVHHLPALAKYLRLEMNELVQLVADQAKAGRVA